MEHLEKLRNEILKINMDEISDSYEIVTTVTEIEKQKVYVWIRLYLKEEVNIKDGDEIEMKYLPSEEVIIAKFISYGKKGLHKDQDNQIVNFDLEDDKKLICLMVDEDEINNRKDIPFIRTLFKTSRFYEHQIIRRSDLIFTNKRTEDIIDYYDGDF